MTDLPSPPASLEAEAIYVPREGVAKGAQSGALAAPPADVMAATLAAPSSGRRARIGHADCFEGRKIEGYL